MIPWTWKYMVQHQKTLNVAGYILHTLKYFVSYLNIGSKYRIEDITWWHEDKKLIFKWEKYFTSECSEQVKFFFT